jgi:excisionase family DNA binding protein
MTVTEVAERYRRTERQVRTAIHSGKLPANRPGTRDYRILAEDAERLFGIVTVCTPASRLERESPTARAARQLRDAGIST